MFDRVLIPLDGSPLAEAVLTQVRPLLIRKEVELLLVQALTVAAGVEVDPSGQLDSLRAEAIRYLEGVEKRLKAEGARVRTFVKAGGAAEVVLDVAEKENASLIVMSTHGRTGPARWLLGSTAEKVLRASPAPVLALRSFGIPGARSFRKLVVGVGGDGALDVLDPVIAFAKVFGSHILLLNVCEGHPQCAVPVPWMTRAYERIREAGLTVEPLMKVGDAAHELLEAAREQGADLIALTTHGRAGPSRWMLGSVAERVLRHAAVPLLVVRVKAGQGRRG